MLVQEIPVGEKLLVILSKPDKTTEWSWEIIEVEGGTAVGSSLHPKPFEIAKLAALTYARNKGKRRGQP